MASCQRVEEWEAWRNERLPQPGDFRVVVSSVYECDRGGVTWSLELGNPGTRDDPTEIVLEFRIGCSDLGPEIITRVQPQWSGVNQKADRVRIYGDVSDTIVIKPVT
jgi:hypothetical protein